MEIVRPSILDPTDDAAFDRLYLTSPVGRVLPDELASETSHVSMGCFVKSPNYYNYQSTSLHKNISSFVQQKKTNTDNRANTVSIIKKTLPAFEDSSTSELQLHCEANITKSLTPIFLNSKQGNLVHSECSSDTPKSLLFSKSDISTSSLQNDNEGENFPTLLKRQNLANSTDIVANKNCEHGFHSKNMSKSFSGNRKEPTAKNSVQDNQHHVNSFKPQLTNASGTIKGLTSNRDKHLDNQDNRHANTVELQLTNEDETKQSLASISDKHLGDDNNQHSNFSEQQLTNESGTNISLTSNRNNHLGKQGDQQCLGLASITDEHSVQKISNTTESSRTDKDSSIGLTDKDIEARSHTFKGYEISADLPCTRSKSKFLKDAGLQESDSDVGLTGTPRVPLPTVLPGGSETVLEDWIVRPYGQWICVEGVKKSSATTTDNVNWHSSTITQRITVSKVATKTGSVYKLSGDINAEDSVLYGLSTGFIKKFKNGFPVEWKRIVFKELDTLQRKLKSVKEKDNLKTNSDKQILLDKKAAKYATNNSELSLLSQSNMNVHSAKIDHVPKSRGGRHCIPTLSWWTGERVTVCPRTQCAGLIAGAPDALDSTLSKKLKTPYRDKKKKTEQYTPDNYLKRKVKHRLSRTIFTADKNTMEQNSQIDKENISDNVNVKQLLSGSKLKEGVLDVIRLNRSPAVKRRVGRQKLTKIVSPMKKDVNDVPAQDVNSNERRTRSKTRNMDRNIDTISCNLNNCSNSDRLVGRPESRKLRAKSKHSELAASKQNRDLSTRHTHRLRKKRPEIKYTYDTSDESDSNSEKIKKMSDGKRKVFQSEVNYRTRSLRQANYIDAVKVETSRRKGEVNNQWNSDSECLTDVEKSSGVEQDRKHQTLSKSSDVKESNVLKEPVLSRKPESTLPISVPSDSELEKLPSNMKRCEQNKKCDQRVQKGERGQRGNKNRRKQPTSVSADSEVEELPSNVKRWEQRRKSKTVSCGQRVEDCRRGERGNKYTRERRTSVSSDSDDMEVLFSNLKKYEQTRILKTISQNQKMKDKTSVSSESDMEESSSKTRDHSRKPKSKLRNQRTKQKTSVSSDSEVEELSSNLKTRDHSRKPITKSRIQRVKQKTSVSSDSDVEESSSNLKTRDHSRKPKTKSRNQRVKQKTSVSSDSDVEELSSDPKNRVRTMKLETASQNHRVKNGGRGERDNAHTREEKPSILLDAEISTSLDESSSDENIQLKKDIRVNKNVAQKKSTNKRTKVISGSYQDVGNSRKNKNTSKKQSAIKNVGNDMDEEAEKSWTTKEKQHLKEALHNIPGNTNNFWEVVATHVGSRGAKECANFNEKTNVEKDQKKKPKKTTASGLGELTGKPGTIKRKRQLREILTNHDEDYDDKVFDATPFKKRKTTNVKNLLGDVEEEEDDYFNNFKTPIAKEIKTPMSRPVWAPMTEVHTPASHLHLTPAAVVHGETNNFNMDRVVHRHKKSSKRKHVFQHDHDAVTEVVTSSKQENMKFDSELFQLKEVSEHDSDSDFYFSDEDHEMNT